jgi:hypothetical protein
MTEASHDELLDALARVFALAAVDRYLAETKTPAESSLSTGVIVRSSSTGNHVERRQHKRRSPQNAIST